MNEVTGLYNHKIEMNTRPLQNLEYNIKSHVPVYNKDLNVFQRRQSDTTRVDQSSLKLDLNNDISNLKLRLNNFNNLLQSQGVIKARIDKENVAESEKNIHQEILILRQQNKNLSQQNQFQSNEIEMLKKMRVKQQDIHQTQQKDIKHMQKLEYQINSFQEIIKEKDQVIEVKNDTIQILLQQIQSLQNDKIELKKQLSQIPQFLNDMTKSQTNPNTQRDCKTRSSQNVSLERKLSNSNKQNKKSKQEQKSGEIRNNKSGVFNQKQDIRDIQSAQRTRTTSDPFNYQALQFTEQIQMTQQYKNLNDILKKPQKKTKNIEQQNKSSNLNKNNRQRSFTNNMNKNILQK